MDRPQPTKANKKDLKTPQACSKAGFLFGDFSDIQMAFHHSGDWFLCLEGTIRAMLQFHSTAGGFIWWMEVFTSQKQEEIMKFSEERILWTKYSSILETIGFLVGSFVLTSSYFCFKHGTRRRAAAAVWRDLPSAAVPNGHPALLRSWRQCIASWGFLLANRGMIGWIECLPFPIKDGWYR